MNTVRKLNWLVPSLYVRVYRGTLSSCQTLRRSLIICEGVSAKDTIPADMMAFPHYM